MDDLRLDPVVIEIGPLGTFQRIRGAVVSALGNNDVFEFDGALLDPAAGVFDVLFQRDVVEDTRAPVSMPSAAISRLRWPRCSPARKAR